MTLWELHDTGIYSVLNKKRGSEEGRRRKNVRAMGARIGASKGIDAQVGRGSHGDYERNILYRLSREDFSYLVIGNSVDMGHFYYQHALCLIVKPLWPGILDTFHVCLCLYIVHSDYT